MQSSKHDISIQIENIFDNNQLSDLKRFMTKRQCLNYTNNILIYIFHVVQTSGILITTIAAGYNMKELVWVGAGVSAVASLIKIFETTNNSMLKKLMGDIKAIRSGNYVDEGALVEDPVPVPPPPQPQQHREPEREEVPTRPVLVQE